ncbi:MAG: hypothetical protein K2I32_06925 [Alistipes sp.]|nr:hypothetical protein [Alistipes sp.]
MAIVILKAPPALVAAFNEIPLVVQTPKARYDQLTLDLAKATTTAERTRIQSEMTALYDARNQDTLDPMTFVAVIETDPVQTYTVTLTPEAGPDGNGYIDLSFIMRRAFAYDAGIDGIVRPNLNLVAQGYIDDNGTRKAFFYALNAVGQPGYYDSYWGFNAYAKLTDTPLIRYKRYPFFLTLRSFDSKTLEYILKFNGRDQLSDRIQYPLGTITFDYDFQSIDMVEVWTYKEQSTQLASYPVLEGCEPDAPFYVRWINASGGWNTWMFERREETDDVEDVSNIQLYITDPIYTQATVSLSATRTVTVGEGLLSKDEYRALAALPRSPRIQWFNEEIRTWQTIVIAEGFSASWNSRNGFGSVEFTFAMPRILTQF